MLLAELEPIHARLALYILGDIDEVEHDEYYSRHLRADLHSFMESRCMNTVNLMLLLFCENHMPKQVNLEDIETTQDYNMFVFELSPIMIEHDSSSDEFVNKPTHTWVVLKHYGNIYVMVDSYVLRYTLHRNFVDIRTHFNKCCRFLDDPSSDTWFDLMGVIEDIDCDYDLTIDAYAADLNINITHRISTLCNKALNTMEKNNSCIYHDDIMCLPLVSEDEVLQKGYSHSDKCIDILRSFVH